VQPLTQSVKETQNQVLAELLAQSKKIHLSSTDKSLYLRKLAWCVMLQTSSAKQIDIHIMDYCRQLTTEADADLKNNANLVVKLVEDYKGF
jgi:hypothetical protein